MENIGSNNIALYGGAIRMVVVTVVMRFVISTAHREQKRWNSKKAAHKRRFLHFKF